MRPTRLHTTDGTYVPESDLLDAIADRDRARAEAARWAARVKLLEARADAAAESLGGKRDPDTEPRVPVFIGCKCGRCGG